MKCYYCGNTIEKYKDGAKDGYGSYYRHTDGCPGGDAYTTCAYANNDKLNPKYYDEFGHAYLAHPDMLPTTEKHKIKIPIINLNLAPWDQKSS